MPDIHVLSPILANQIAAGEVVERPASVVKELVENSIDAGASCITVSITDGGISSIVVSDNGCGIEKDQCCDAFLRHATSKISSVEDLSSIDSLGFRGEALASISAVSSVTLTTRTPNSDMGMSVCVDAGNTLFAKEIACPAGTTIKVENLFAKTPARLRFLKSPRFEAGHCADFISRMILAHPEISFRFSQDGKTIYESYGDNNLKTAIFSVYGNHIYSHLLPVDMDDGYIKIDGFIGTQEISHTNRNLESFFVNGRYIRSSSLSNAIENAFLTKIMVGRFPFALIRITIAPKEVDVNIHPAKTQIKFVNETRVSESVAKACSLALRPAIIPQISIPTKATTYTSKPSAPEKKDIPDITKSVAERPSVSDQPHFYDISAVSSVSKPSYAEYRKQADSYSYNDFTVKKESRPIPVYTAASARNAAIDESAPVQESLPISKEYTLIGCAFNSYWIVEYDDNLYLIDQHAACERKLYEKYISEPQGNASQALLIPKVMTLPPEDFELAEKHRDVLENIGFRFTKNGNYAYSIEAVPFINGKLFEAEYLCEAIRIIENTGKASPSDLIYEALVYSSCKHSIKAGERITNKEMIALIDQFIDNSIPLTCPHGRPVIIKLSKQEIEKGFKRIV